MQDTRGNTYAGLSKLAVGQTVWLDEGFDCRAAGPVIVRMRAGEFGFLCREGFHSLEGCLDYSGEDPDALVGVYAEEPK